ncbi:MAG TPA: NAD(P)H-hydrate dehydratase [Mesorhizobium sp.]|jgi:hydroxyethylthiazole kinase-like uncharacterized protein yjeF|nr:NAD(P)H-hydrate dehydratase [Mesorhizobium sp.]
MDARFAILSTAEMAQADRRAAETLGGSTWPLMLAAGQAVARRASALFPAEQAIHVLCGPGNNGGDGFVAAAELSAAGRAVRLWALGQPTTPDARRAAECWRDEVEALADFPSCSDAGAVIDALFGAGLRKPLEGAAAAAAEAVAKKGARVLAVDLPSGLDGNTGRPLGPVFQAAHTVTFARRKPAHVLYPGRALCGAVEVADIGISDEVIASLEPALFENDLELWRNLLPWPEADTHKYSRGHAAVFSGGPTATGAARLAALAAARAGAGAVTMLSPSSALLVHATHLTSIMLRRVETGEELRAFREASRARAYVLGPGFGGLEPARAFALALLGSTGSPTEPSQATDDLPGVVLDADGITAFRDDPRVLFQAAAGPVRLVLTPHEGEFARLLPDLAPEVFGSKIERAREAARRANAVVVLKGPDTAVAAPHGQAVVNTNATPFLATAGSGDVLAGLIGGLLAQGMPVFEAACAGAWLHAEAGSRFGPGLMAEDLPGLLPGVLAELAPASHRPSAQRPARETQRSSSSGA